MQTYVIRNEEDGPRSSVFIEFIPSRGPVRASSATGPGGREMRLDWSSYRSLRISGAALQPGESIELSYEKLGEPFVEARREWTIPGNPAPPPTPTTDVEVFAARLAQIEELETDNDAPLHEERFFFEYDRETYVDPDHNVPKALWTDLTTGEPLPESEIKVRSLAIDEATKLLELRMRARGRGETLPGWTDLTLEMRACLHLIGDLHLALFRNCEAFREGLDIDARKVGTALMRFTNGDFRKKTPMAGGEFLNGEPNGYFYVLLPELISLLSTSGHEEAFWKEVLPGAVAAIAVYGHTYCNRNPDEQTLESYQPRMWYSHPEKEPLDDADVERVVDRFLGLQPDIEAHWATLLRLIARDSFDVPTPLQTLDFYLE